MPYESVAPSWPFGRWWRIPRRQVIPRTMCRYCCGGGTVNDCPCPGGCDGRGWFDADYPPPKQN